MFPIDRILQHITNVKWICEQEYKRRNEWWSLNEKIQRYNKEQKATKKRPNCSDAIQTQSEKSSKDSSEKESGVSVEEKFGIMDIVISALKKSGTTVLFVEHDMEIVERYVDRVIAFYQGQVICDDTPKKALKDKKVIQ